MTGVNAMLMRGGSSKGLFFVRDELPASQQARDALLLQLMGSPDDRQIDGVGGAHPLTSKVAVVAASASADADIDYLFLQVSVDEALVSDRQNCGNMLAGVGPFAIERGLIRPESSDHAEVRILMENTGSVATASFALDHGAPIYDGDTAISGVPGTAAPIRLDFADIAGGSCGALLPTGNAVDLIDGVACTLIDNGMPVVVLRADSMGISGYEAPADLEANTDMRGRLESIRLQAGQLMNLGDVADTTVPKLTMVAPPRTGGAICTRTFIPHRCHEAIGVLGAVSVATAALLPGTPASEVITPNTPDGSVTLEHPTGSFEAAITMVDGTVTRSGIIRTARKLMDGIVY